MAFTATSLSSTLPVASAAGMQATGWMEGEDERVRWGRRVSGSVAVGDAERIGACCPHCCLRAPPCCQMM